MTAEAGDAGGGKRRRAVNPRVVLALAALAALICGTVIVVDRLSPRQRAEAHQRSLPYDRGAE